MRPKELKLVITFHTTTGAMKMEKICKETGALGRLIPVPQQISAGCGLAWCAPVAEKEPLLELIHKHEIPLDSVYEIVI